MTGKHFWNSDDENGKTDDQSVHKLPTLITGTLNGKKRKIKKTKHDIT
jgi:hypothetical protein